MSYIENSNYLLWAEPIQEQLEINEDGKSMTKSQFKVDQGKKGNEIN